MNISPTHPLHFLTLALGTFGDVHPFLGIGRALAARGHRVDVLSNPLYRGAIEASGLNFVGIGSEEDFLSLLQNPRMWKPLHGARILGEGLILPYMDPVFRAIEQRCGDQEPIVLAPVTAFGARIAAEALGVKVATIALQPVLFRSVYDSPGLPFIPSSRGSVARSMRRGVYRFVDQFLFDAVLRRPVNDYRKQFGLSPQRLLIREWVFSPDLIVGLFPDWFGAPQPDWPSHAVTSGFPLFDEAANREAPPALKSFLDADNAPVLLTPGTGNCHAKEFFEAGVAACERLCRRALLLTHFPGQVPANLASQHLCLDYAPFSQVLPRVACVAHHGGIGTSAQALAAGTPQLIVPSSFDQPDNAARLERLGVGRVLWPWRHNAANFERQLAYLMGSETVRQRCIALAAKTNAVTDATCEVLEEFGRRR